MQNVYEKILSSKEKFENCKDFQFVRMKKCFVKRFYSSKEKFENCKDF